MSYILDALKRAEVERERGTAPRLHAQLFPGAVQARDLYSPAGWPWRWIVLALVLILAAYGGWRYWSSPALVVSSGERSASSNMEATAGSTPSNPPPATEVVKPSAQTAAAPVALQTVPLTRRDTVARVQVGESPARSVSVRTANPAPVAAQPVPQPVKRTARAEVEEAPKLNRTAAAPASVAPVAETVKWGELPDAIRQQIPPLNISGVVYSESGREKILLINDKLVTRGSLAAPEVRLEEVGENSATFSYRGRLFRLDL